MADKKSKKNAKTLSKKAMKKSRGGFAGGVSVAAGDINGDGIDSIAGVARKTDLRR